MESTLSERRFKERLRGRAGIGADVARAWVRGINLRNPYAKAVLMAIANYMNEDGAAWPGLATLSRDTDIAEDTIAARLRWCEEIGAIVQLKTWVDENGRRNHDRRGRPTSSEIRFCFDADIDALEEAAQAARGERVLRGAAAKAHATREEPKEPAEPDVSDSSDSAFSARPGRGLTVDGLHPVSALIAPEQPPPGAVRSKNLEQEKLPPNPPQAGGGDVAVDQELENEIEEFKRVYPAQITNLPRLRSVLTSLSKIERRQVIAGARGYAAFIAECARKGKARAVKDADRWVANGLWQGYVASGEHLEERALMRQVDVESDDGKAWAMLHKIARMSPPFETGGKYLLQRPLSPQGLAMAHAPPDEHWVFVQGADRNQCAAWNEFIARELGGKARPPLVSDRNPGGVVGFPAPWSWPPRKDGSVGTGPP